MQNEEFPCGAPNILHSAEKFLILHSLFFISLLCEFSIKRSFVLTYWLYLHVEQQTIRKR